MTQDKSDIHKITAHAKRVLITYCWKVGGTVTVEPGYTFKVRRSANDPWSYAYLQPRDAEANPQMPDRVDFVVDVHTDTDGHRLPRIGISKISPRKVEGTL